MKKKRLRDAIISIYLKKEKLFGFIFRLLFSLLGFIILNTNFGYNQTISHLWFAVALGIVCAFLKVNISSLVMYVYMCIQLFSLSWDSLGVFLILGLVGFMISRGVEAKHSFYLIYMSVFYTISVPFLGVLYEALFGKKREMAPIICGGAIAYYLRVMGLNSVGIKNEETVSAFTVLRDNMLTNTSFYFFLFALAAMFLVIYFLKRIRIRYSYGISSLLGIVVAYIIMISGYLSIGNMSRFVPLTIGSIVTLAIGFLMSYLLGESRISGLRELEFEDDDYIYHVIAIPKIRMENYDKRVKTITRPNQNGRNTNETGAEDKS